MRQAGGRVRDRLVVMSVVGMPSRPGHVISQESSQVQALLRLLPTVPSPLSLPAPFAFHRCNLQWLAPNLQWLAPNLQLLQPNLQ